LSLAPSFLLSFLPTFLPSYLPSYLPTQKVKQKPSRKKKKRKQYPSSVIYIKNPPAYTTITTMPPRAQTYNSSDGLFLRFFRFSIFPFSRFPFFVFRFSF